MLPTPDVHGHEAPRTQVGGRGIVGKCVHLMSVFVALWLNPLPAFVPLSSPFTAGPLLLITQPLLLPTLTFVTLRPPFFPSPPPPTPSHPLPAPPLPPPRPAHDPTPSGATERAREREREILASTCCTPLSASNPLFFCLSEILMVHCCWIWLAWIVWK